jgi:choline dehydrogenase-like flavoprotein
MADADFIIVGAGSTGCALAGRLSESSAVSVLVIEAGGPAEGEIFDVPSQWGRQFTTKYDWDYVSELEPGFHCRRTYLPRGKALGGTSAMNAMLYVRGVPADFDGWETQGATGWGWTDVLPYFIRAENNVRGRSELHGDAGPLFVSDRVSNNRLAEAWIETALSAGYKFNEDFNGPDQEGVGYYQLTQRNGRRWSSFDAYLRDNIGRPNLSIIPYRQATRIVLDGTRATGVEVEHDGQREVYTADKEVIVCTGAYNSPQLLMLSGIGPRDHLVKLGIEVVADLPVGDNLQDHPGVPVALATEEETLFESATPDEWERYRATGEGILSSNGVEGGGFVRSEPGLANCDLQLFLNPWPFMGDIRTAPTMNGFAAVAEVLRPKSVGTVRLRTAEPTGKPLVTHNHFDDPSDIEPLMRGMRLILDMLARSPIADLGGEPLRWPRATDDAGLEEYIRANALGFFHPSSTCAMGTVLDCELRVNGIEGLRVADASAMPTTMRGNPNASCIMMGEKASDLIADAYGLGRAAEAGVVAG